MDIDASPRSLSFFQTGVRRRAGVVLAVVLTFGMTLPQAAHADALTRANAAYARGDYVRAVRELSPLVRRGHPRALAMLGFMYEHGYGTPQFYDAAADLYAQAATQGVPFAQGMLGLMYDKGHGVPQDMVLAYMWLDLAAARAPRRERSIYMRFRDAVASKMTSDQIAEGQRLAFGWTAGR